MSNITGESDSAASPIPSASPRDGDVWDVAEILAERTSVSGENELLVVWKHSWIPISNMHSDGPVMRNFRDTPKWKFNSASGAMRLILPVEPGTVLADDCAAIVAAADAVMAAASTGAAATSDLTPNPALGMVAKPATQQQQKRRKA